MNEQLNHIRQLINEGHVDTAISRLNDWLQKASSPTAEAYYLLGNAYRKKSDWQGALNNYQEAIALDPESPAADARKMVMDILNFYNKDMFNQ